MDTESTAASSGSAAYGIPSGQHRLPAATRVGPVALQIGDLSRSLTYYEKVLGLRVLRQDAEHAAAPGTTLGHIHLHVGDLEAAAGFYHRALGLDATLWSYPGALFLSAGGYHHHLGVNTWAGPLAGPPDVGEARLLEWTLVVPRAEEVEAVRRSLHDAGYLTGQAVGASWTVEDPWGTALRIGPEEASG